MYCIFGKYFQINDNYLRVITKVTVINHFKIYSSNDLKSLKTNKTLLISKHLQCFFSYH